MKFKIYSKALNNRERYHIYDNITQSIITDEEVPVYLDEDPRLEEFANRTKRSKLKASTGKDTEDIILRIQLGLKCNFHCKYCNQANLAKNAIPIAEDLSTKVNNFILRLQKLNLKVSEIALWGGEPLVYWKTIKLLAPLLNKLYGKKTPITCISNASLWNREKADFFLDHNIHLTISHDGESFNKYRNDKNPLDDPEIIEALNYYYEKGKDKNTNFSINVVIVPENHKIEKLESYFQEKFGRKDIVFHFESIVKCDHESVDLISKFSEQDAKELIDRVVAYGTTQDADHNYWDIRKKVSQVINRLVNTKNLMDYQQSCDVNDSKTWEVDLDGNFIPCHGFPANVRSFGKLEEYATVTGNDFYIPWFKKEGCKECPFAVSCLGGCSIAFGEDHKIACENLKIWHGALFVSAWYLLFNSYITRIEPL